MQKLTPFLWFDSQAEDAARFYTSLFKNSHIESISRYGPETPGVEGSVMTVDFYLENQHFVALNGGPVFHFTPAISFFVDCKDQAEVDELWENLCAGGQPSQCGWVTDKFGVTWQIVPTALMEMMNDPDPVKANRVTQAMLQMSKIEISVLEKAYEGS